MPRTGFVESILLMVLLISLPALSIDTMLPVFPEIARDLNVQQANDIQLIIPALIFGLATGQLVFGPLSDSMGRKSVLTLSAFIFMAGCLLCFFSVGLPTMLAGRVVQGVGISGPRTVVLALIRDQYEGRAMARMMSIVMSVFIIIPAFAPLIGQGIALVAGWRAIFASLLALMLIALIWFARRQPETLLPRNRIAFSLREIAGAFVLVCSTRVTLGYTIMAGLVMGAFFGYLNSAQQIFQDVYGVGRLFSLFFAILSLSLGCASLLNSRIVMRHGMRTLTKRAMVGLFTLSMVYVGVICAMGGVSPLWMFMAFFMIIFFCVGILFGNLNAIAMKPLGQVAGTASAVVGSLSTLIAVPPGAFIGLCYNGTILPLMTGFAVLSLFSFAIMRWAETE